MWSLSVIGFILFLALPILVRASQYATHDHTGWLVLTVYGWYFLLVTLFQIRFAGEFAAFVSIFAGYGFVWIGARYDLIRSVVFNRQDGIRNAAIPSVPKLGILLVLFLVISSVGAHQADRKINSVVVNDGIHQTATEIEEHAETNGITYPENYVLSRWSYTRVYNYFVSGESESYQYSKANYEELISSTGSEESAYNLTRGRYIVMQITSGIANFRSENPEQYKQLMQYRLYDSYGSRTDETAGLSHFKALYATPDERYRAFEIVPGAVLKGQTQANAGVVTATQVQIPNKRFTYERATTADANGTYRITVANSGEYIVQTNGRNTTVSVSETAVRSGQTVSVTSFE
jgi:dolichyl-diphosphooligosaccharide--protein glycosyltransferase